MTALSLTYFIISMKHLTYPFSILDILPPSPDEEADVDHKNYDLSHIQGGVLEEVHVGEYVLEVYGIRLHGPATAEAGEMSGGAHGTTNRARTQHLGYNSTN